MQVELKNAQLQLAPDIAGRHTQPGPIATSGLRDSYCVTRAMPLDYSDTMSMYVNGTQSLGRQRPSAVDVEDLALNSISQNIDNFTQSHTAHTAAARANLACSTTGEYLSLSHLGSSPSAPQQLLPSADNVPHGTLSSLAALQPTPTDKIMGKTSLTVNSVTATNNYGLPLGQVPPSVGHNLANQLSASAADQSHGQDNFRSISNTHIQTDKLPIEATIMQTPQGPVVIYPLSACSQKSSSETRGRDFGPGPIMSVVTTSTTSQNNVASGCQPLGSSVTYLLTPPVGGTAPMPPQTASAPAIEILAGAPRPSGDENCLPVQSIPVSTVTSVLQPISTATPAAVQQSRCPQPRPPLTLQLLRHGHLSSLRPPR